MSRGETGEVVTKDMMDCALQTVMEEMRNMLRSHKEAWEGILLRPTLDKDLMAGQATTLAAASEMQPRELPPVSAAVKKTKRKKKKKSLAAQAVEASRVQPEITPTLPPAQEAWTAVVKHGAKKRVVKAGEPSRIPIKLTVPRSSAVVFTLQPSALDKGIDYEKVVSLARDKVDVASLDIPFLKFKETATGSRKLEVPGVASASKADRLAERLDKIFAETVGEGMVHVSRPTRCAELRLTGLDDAATKEEVAAAVAVKGDCSVHQVKVGEVRRLPYRSGTVWVRCPVAAAKKIVQARRLLLGWVAVQATLLQPRAARCFRCLATGHTRQRCKADTDRSELCFHCGKGGHIASKCVDPPHCLVCAEAKRPADHRWGSKSCAPPPVRRGKVPATNKVVVPSAGSRPGTGQVMEVCQQDGSQVPPDEH